MRPTAVLLVLPLVLTGVGRAFGDSDATPGLVQASRELQDSEPSVAGSLVQVWYKFGDLAASLLKIHFLRDNADGRGSKAGKLVIPLVIGFKITGAIVAGLTALKVLILKTVAVSGLALLVSLALGGAYIYDRIKNQGHHDDHKYYYVPQESAWSVDHQAQNEHSTGYSHHQHSDLQGHSSEYVTESLDPHQNTYYQTTEAYSAPFMPSDPQRKSFHESVNYSSGQFQRNG